MSFLGANCCVHVRAAVLHAGLCELQYEDDSSNCVQRGTAQRHDTARSIENVESVTHSDRQTLDFGIRIIDSLSQCSDRWFSPVKASRVNYVHAFPQISTRTDLASAR